VGSDRVFDRQRVKVELIGDVGKFSFGRLVEADPGDSATVPADLAHRGEVPRLGCPDSVPVDGSVDDHTTKLPLAPGETGTGHRFRGEP